MVGLGILLIILGFGSLILDQMGYVFRVLAWAEDYQPGIGIGVGILGVILLVVGVLMKRKNETNVTINNAPPQGQVPPQNAQQWAPPAGQQPVQNDPRYTQEYRDNPPRG